MSRMVTVVGSVCAFASLLVSTWVSAQTPSTLGGHAAAADQAAPSPSAQTPARSAPATAASAPAASQPMAAPAPDGMSAESHSNEPVWIGNVQAPPVQAPPPPPSEPPPPPVSYRYPAEGLPPPPPAACPPGSCNRHCRHGCKFEPRKPPPAPQHLGLLLRVTTGWGVGMLYGKNGRDETSLLAGLALDAGAAVIENVIVRARFRTGVTGFRESEFGDDVLFSYGAAGAGVDYYFMPVNVYLGGTISVAGVARSTDDRVNHSKAGLGLDIDLGKEWWLGTNWGVGIAARASYVDVGAEHTLRGGGRLRSWHLGLQFSATYN
jgi:hypothetical protein